MKKLVLLCACIFAGTAFLAAEDMDGLIKKAVDGLASRLTAPIEVSVEELFLEGTKSPSAFSRYLASRINAHAPANPLFTVVSPSRGIFRPMPGGPQKCVIKGGFLREGNLVRVTLRLVEENRNFIMETRDFSVPLAELQGLNIALLPDNFKTVEEIKEQEEIFVPPAPPPPVPPANTPVFSIKAWPDSDTATYIDGDEMNITLIANQNCYVKVYHIDVNRQMQLIFPNQLNRNNYLAANITRIIPEAPVQLTLHAPFGQETIYVIASGEQFQNLEAEFAQIREASREAVQSAAVRGASLQIKPGSAQAAGTTETRFHYTILPATYADAVFQYRKPADMAGAVRTMENEIRRQGGTFTGNEREGTFSASGIQGSYRVSGNTLIMSIRYMGNQPPLTRGAAPAYSFSFDKPANIRQAVQTARAGIENKGGAFSGDESTGNFRASGIAGQYSVAGRVTVTIHEKPALIPNSLIENEIKKFFNVR
ncbi:MAG: DUF4384 domain-containing protein [Treponema sp.]|nr:DUF4384 domain-containing protein [Treponema sp.]